MMILLITSNMRLKYILLLLSIVLLANEKVQGQNYSGINPITEVEIECEPTKESRSLFEEGELKIIVYSGQIELGELRVASMNYDSSFTISTNKSYTVTGLRPGKFSIYFRGDNIIDSAQVIIEERVIRKIESCECISIGIESEKPVFWASSNESESLVSSKSKVCPTETTEYSLTVVDTTSWEFERIINYSVITSGIEFEMDKIPFLSCVDVESVKVSTKEDYLSYMWSTGDTTATIEISEGGEYDLEVISSPSCRIKKQFIISDDKNDPCMDKYLIDKGFISQSCEIKVIDRLNDNEPTTINGYKKIIIKVFDRFSRQGIEMNLVELGKAFITKIGDHNLDVAVFITTKDDICSGNFLDVETAYNSYDVNNKLWMHICDNKNYDVFFYKSDLEDDIVFLDE